MKSMLHLETTITALFREVKLADDPTEPFEQLMSAWEEYMFRSRQLREDWFRQRNTVVQQAATIASEDIDRLSAGWLPAIEVTEHPVAPLPDTFNVISAPNCLIVRLSFGFVNLLQVALLDVNSAQLYLCTGAVYQLLEKDVKTISYHLQFYISQ